MSDIKAIPVGGDYEVLIGRGLTDQVVGAIPATAQRVLIVHAPVMADLAEQVAAQARAAGFEAFIKSLPDAEAAKTSAVAASLWSRLGAAGFTRTDVVIAIGGGATTDLGGFVAATWLRGVEVIQVPTTVLGMVDAAVGGKTGINTDEGKNLVGAFHPPRSVVCDLDVLRSLPAADVAAGMAEVVKCGFIRDRDILRLVRADPQAALDVDGAVLPELIARAVRVKAQVVAADLRESNLREILNYGHTFAHAIEQVEQYSWRHGDAVAVGMVFAAELTHAAGLLSERRVHEHREILTSLGLPTSYRADRWNELLTAMQRDKKTRGSQLRFVVLGDEGTEPTRLEGPRAQWLQQAYDAISARPSARLSPA